MTVLHGSSGIRRQPSSGTDSDGGLALLLVVRPVVSVLTFADTSASWPGRALVGAFGIRAIGSFFSLSDAIAGSSFQEIELVVAEELWAFTGVVHSPIVVHGVSSHYVMKLLDRHQGRPGRDGRRLVMPAG